MRVAGTLVAVLLLGVPAGRAATLHVPAAYPTVGAALAVAGAGDSVRIAPGRYPEYGLTVPGGVTLLGEPTPTAETWFDGAYAGVPILRLPAGAAPVRIRDLTFRYGSSGFGGAILAETGPGRHVLESCTFERNRYTAVRGDYLDVLDCTFAWNDGDDGGALRGAHLLVRNGVFRGNHASSEGGALWVASGEVIGCRFEVNVAGDRGGAIYNQAAVIRASSFLKNGATSTSGHGGAIYGASPQTISGCDFVQNHADRDGGAVLLAGHPSVIELCRFVDNDADRGGGVAAGAASITVERCSFLGNRAGTGGTVFAPSATTRQLTLRHSVLAGTASGGTIAGIAGASVPTLEGNDLHGNAGGDWTGLLAGFALALGNFSADPLFCPDPRESLFVSAASPLLAANNDLGADVGAARAGCEVTGVVVSSRPPGITLEADGVPFVAPAVFDWTPGSVHTISAPLLSEPVWGVQAEFQDWSDGGDATHAVTAAGGAGFAASFSRRYRLEVTGDAGGSTSPGSAWLVPGTATTILALPDSGYEHLGWVGTGPGSYTGPLSQVVVPMIAPVTQHARFRYTGNFFLTMIAGPGGTVLPPSGPYPGGALVTIHATPAAGHAFAFWTGTGSGSYTGTSATAQVTMNENLVQEATFEPGTLTLTMVAQPGGSVTPPTGTYLAGTSVEIAAAPDLGYVFNRWVGTGAGSYSGTSSEATVVMNADIREEARFTEVGTWELIMVALPGGTVTPASGPQSQSSDVTIEAHPSTGWDFVRWLGTGSGSYSGPSPLAVVTMNGPIEQVAEFRWRAGTAPVAMRVVGDGTVTPPSGEYAVNTPLAIHATPGLGSVFDRWVGEGVGSYTGPIPDISILVLGPIVQTAYFAPGAGYPLTMTATEGGLVYPHSGNRAAGAVIQISATPFSGYRFVEWQGEGMDSYSGPDASASIAMHGPITQLAVFESDNLTHGYEFSISSSDTDPFRNTAAPAGGPRQLHLWLTCSQQGISALECGVQGTLPLFGFDPAPGVFNIGSGNDLLIAISDCPTGEPVHRRLGAWTVLDTGGSLCLGHSAAHEIFAAVDCSPFPSLWWRPRARGFSSDGTPPCYAGSFGCADVGTAVATIPGTVPASTAFLAAVPNPFLGTTELRFGLAAPGRARLTVYDVAGRLIRVLRDREFPAGIHAERWDGRTDVGAAAGGIYFVRLEAGDHAETKRVVFLGPAR